MKDANYNAALDLLDVELLDADQRRCGRVDDVELSGEVGDVLEIAALLVGRGAWRARLPRWLRPLARGGPVRVPWDEVFAIGSAIRLKRPDRDYCLNDRERGPSRWVSSIPGS